MNQRRPAATLLLALLLTGGVAAANLGAHRPGRPSGPAIVWVFFRDRSAAPGPRLADGRPSEPVNAAYLESLRGAGARIRHVTRWLNGASVAVDPNRVAELGRLPFVREVRPVLRGRHRAGPEERRFESNGSDDPGVKVAPAEPSERLTLPSRGLRLGPEAPGTVAAPAFAGDETWHYGASFNQSAQVGIIDLHREGYTGAGITVAIFDSGFRTGHPALASRHVLAERDFVFNDGDVDNQPADPSSAWNHGTSVWSNVGGYKPGALIGGAFEATILLGKTENIASETPVEEDNFIAAIEWADSLGADIITASLLYLDFDGTSNDYTYADLDGDTTPLAIAVDMAVARGICMINSAGNFGPGAGSIWTPADADSVLSVGAVDSMGVIAAFSSRGPTPDGRIKPEVVARGVRNFVASASSNAYGQASGTSFSAPVTAGAAALLKEAHPGWSGWQLREALRSTASHPATPDNITGWGLVRATMAAALAPKTLPRVSRRFSLEQPDRGVTVATAAPVFRWGHSRGNPGDVVTYRVVLGTSPTLAGADTLAGGTDSTWVPPMYLVPGITYYWQVVATNLAGWHREALRPGMFTVSAGAGVADARPVSGALQPAMTAPVPNPSRGVTHLSVLLPARGTDELSGSDAATWAVDVIGIDGRRYRRLAAGPWEAAGGSIDLSWDGRDDDGRATASGVYFLRLVTPEGTSSQRLVLTRH